MLLCLDFDGVICDSVLECFVSSWITYFHKYLKIKPESMERSLKGQFLLLRPYIRNAEDYPLIQELIYTKRKIGSQEEFDSEILQCGKEKMAHFNRLMDEVRAEMIETEKEYWISLNPLFSKISELLHLYMKNEKIHIVSAKKPEQILEILEANGICFSQTQIHYSWGRKKVGIIQELLNACKDNMVIFIDDQISHIREIKDNRIKPLLAAWGYIQGNWLEQLKKDKIVYLEEMPGLFSQI